MLRCSIHLRCIDYLTASGTHPLDQRCRNPYCSEHRATAEVGDEVEGRNWSAARFTDVVQYSAYCQIIQVMSGVIRQWPGLTPTALPRTDQTRVALQSVF